MKESKDIHKRRWSKLFILAAIAAVIILVFQLTPLSVADFTPVNVKNFILSFGVWAPVVFIAVYALRGAVLVIPVGIMSFAGGLAFGQWFGTIYILIGATLGASLSFIIARYFGRKFVESFGWLHKGKIRQFDEGIEKRGFRMILFMRLIPLFQYDAVNFGSGLSKMKFRDFLIGSFIGMAPGGFINAMLGSSLENIISVQFFAALGFFILLMFVPFIYKRIRRKKEKPPDAKTAGQEQLAVKSGDNQTGKCPDCGNSIGPVSIIAGWNSFGKFICPGCSSTIQFKTWLLAAAVLTLLFIGTERLLRLMLVSPLPLWASFTMGMLLAMMIMFFVPRVWTFRKGGQAEKEKQHENI